MSNPLPEPQNPVYLYDQVTYALSLFDTEKLGGFIPHMEAHWGKSEESCLSCYDAWKAMPWGIRIEMHNNYTTEKDE